MSEHTPGPWKIRREVLQPLPGCERFGTDEAIAGIDTEWDHGQLHGPMPIVTTGSGVHGTHADILREEDAHLIAAAPDLLAACEAALELDDGSQTGIGSHLAGVLRAAIAKAKGQQTAPAAAPCPECGRVHAPTAGACD